MKNTPFALKRAPFPRVDEKTNSIRAERRNSRLEATPDTVRSSRIFEIVRKRWPPNTLLESCLERCANKKTMRKISIQSPSKGRTRYTPETKFARVNVRLETSDKFLLSETRESWKDFSSRFFAMLLDRSRNGKPTIGEKLSRVDSPVQSRRSQEDQFEDVCKRWSHRERGKKKGRNGTRRRPVKSSSFVTVTASSRVLGAASWTNYFFGVTFSIEARAFECSLSSTPRR